MDVIPTDTDDTDDDFDPAAAVQAIDQIGDSASDALGDGNVAAAQALLTALDVVTDRLLDYYNVGDPGDGEPPND